MFGKYWMMCIFALVFYSCSKDNVHTQIDDPIGVIPEIEDLDVDIKPFQITEVDDGWVFCQEGANDFVHMNKQYGLVAKTDIPGNSHWINKVPIDVAPNGNIYQLYVDETSRNQLLLNEVDINGVNVSLTLLGAQFNDASASFLKVISDSILFLAVNSKDPGTNRFHTCLFKYNLNSKFLDTFHILDGSGVVLAYNAGKEGHWLSIAWKNHPAYHFGGSIFLFDMNGEVLNQNYYPDISIDWYYNNRTGLIIESKDGSAEVLVGVMNEYPDMGVLMGNIAHLTIKPNGQVAKIDAYSETLGQKFMDFYRHDGKIYILSKEKSGSNLTHDMLLQVISPEGLILHSIYIRNTSTYNDFSAITDVNGFHANLITYDKEKSSLVKISF